METKKIAIIKGDGVGPEVVNEGLKILKIINEYSDLSMEYIEAPAGGSIYKTYGESLPEKSLNIIKKSDAILFGAIGLPDLPPGVAELAILKIRQKFDLYINLRPVKLFETIRDCCPLKDEYIGDGIDMTIVRENTEGLYAKIGGILRDEIATNIMLYTRKGCERVIKYAFEYTKKRNHKKITSVDKANVLACSQLWRKIFEEIGMKYPNIDKENFLIDSFCQWIIRKPYTCQTVVTGNLFGDIISDEAAYLLGSLGMAPSGNINPGNLSMYEPIHGAAPDIAGQGIANPVGTILSVKLMVEESFQRKDLGKDIENCVEQALGEGRTMDIKSDKLKILSTVDMGNLITNKLKERLKK